MTDRYNYEDENEQRELETSGDAIVFLNDPDIKKLDRMAFTKDTVLANLSDSGINIVSNHFELARELRLIGLKKAGDFIIANGLDLVILSNARKGFARKQVGTQTKEYKIQDSEEQRSKYLPEIRKRRKGGEMYE